MASYIFTPLSGPPGGTATGINDAGEVVGWYSDFSEHAGADCGFVTNGETYASLSDPAANVEFGSGTTANAINNNGQIVGTYFTNSGATLESGFIYNGTYSTLGDPTSPSQTYAQGINDDGLIVGFFYTILEDGAASVAEGFLDQNCQYSTLTDSIVANTLTGGGTFPMSVNDSGEVVGYTCNVSVSGSTVFNSYLGFLYKDGIFTTLSYPLAGVEGTFANGINNLGQIVGT